jgi:hypothetical protein
MHKDKYAVSIHGKQVRQLECFSDPSRICDEFGPTEIDCNNTSPPDSPHFEWNCEPVNWSLRHQVIENEIRCEGWDGDDDPYVVGDSCWIQLKMVYDRVQVQVDRSDLGIIIPFAFVALAGLVVVTACVWRETWAAERGDGGHAKAE